MNKLRGILLLALSLLLTAFPALGAVTLPFSDDFEAYPIGSPPPAPWFNLPGGASTVTDWASHSPTKSIAVWGGPLSSQSAVVDLGLSYPDTVGYEVWGNISGPNTGAFIGFFEQNVNMAPQFNSVYFSGIDGKVYFVSSDMNYPISIKLLDNFTIGAWYKVRVEIDYTHLKANVYINDILVGKHLPASPRNATWELGGFIYSFPLRKVGVIHYFGENCYFDDFSAFEWKLIQIDIKPGSCPNSINLKSKGVVPVAILGSKCFNVTSIDLSTIEFAGAKPVRWALEYVNGDCYKDLILHFRTQELGLTPKSTEACLMGMTHSDMPIRGWDSVRIVPPHPKVKYYQSGTGPQQLPD